MTVKESITFKGITPVLAAPPNVELIAATPSVLAAACVSDEESATEIETQITLHTDLPVSMFKIVEEQVETDIRKDGNSKALLKQLCRQEHYKEVAQVMAWILVCKPNSADCEKLVSVYSSLKTSTRSWLLRETISNYLYVSMNMHVFTMFNPRPAVHYFLQDRNHRVRDIPKADRQV
eukprot:gene5649-10879_t